MTLVRLHFHSHCSKNDTDSSGYSTEVVLEIENEVQESFDEILESVSCDQILNLTSDMFDEKDKKTVITWLVDALDSLRRSRNMLRDAAGEIDLLQRKQSKTNRQLFCYNRRRLKRTKRTSKLLSPPFRQRSKVTETDSPLRVMD